MALAKDFFTTDQLDDLKQVIQNAELDTSGEIRLHIENKCNGDVMDRAAFIFEKLEMNKTNLRNGVLFYLAIKNRKFAIIGDVGINNMVPDDFWEKIKHKMLNQFRENMFYEGLCEGVQKAGEQLKKHFPHQMDDVNELPDEISFGDN
ncbi:TPM domain-containing protein [candidate division KSB1 bacterium]